MLNNCKRIMSPDSSLYDEYVIQGTEVGIHLTNAEKKAFLRHYSDNEWEVTASRRNLPLKIACAEGNHEL